MRLRDRNRSPVGGFYYISPTHGRITTSGNFNKLVRAVQDRYMANKTPIPEDLADLIEDQICMRQPADRCYYGKGLGDRISQVVHAGAKVVDKVLGTKLEKKARGCGGCGKRRARLNALTKNSR